MTETVLACAGVGLDVPSGSGRLTILSGASLSLSTGEVMAIMGRSGSGKTSLLSILGLMQRPTRGQVHVTVAGEAVSAYARSDAQRAVLRNGSFGYVFQGYSLMPHLTARENVALPLSYGRRPRSRDGKRVDELLSRVGLAEAGRKYPRHLSGGEQQRVAIARALVREPRVVLADEPTGSLDATVAGEVLDLLVSTTRQAGCAVVVVTHDPVVAAVADRVVHIEGGRLVEGHPVIDPGLVGQPRLAGPARSGK